MSGAASLGDCYWHPGVPYDMGVVLCEPDGMVRPGQRVDGVVVPYPCTGGAHYGGMHIRCTSVAHAAPAPAAA